MFVRLNIDCIGKHIKYVSSCILIYTVIQIYLIKESHIKYKSKTRVKD